MSLKDEIINYSKMFDIRGSISANIVNRNSKFHKTALYSDIVNATNFLIESASLNERVYCILNNIQCSVVCTECDNLVKFRNGVYGYAKTCCIACSNKSKAKHISLTNNNIKKFGVPYTKQRHIPVDVLSKLNDPAWCYDQHYNQNRSVQELAELCQVSESLIVKRFRKFRIKLKSLQSGPETRIVEYIAAHYDTEIICNTYDLIPPKEIDIFLPAYNIAFEVNGLYWHRPDRFNNKEEWISYHQNKEELCNKKGIKLQHIWDGYNDNHSQIDNAMNGIIENNLTLIYEEVNWP